MTTVNCPTVEAGQPPCVVVALDRAGELVAETDKAFNALLRRPVNPPVRVGSIVSSAQIAQLLTPR